MKKKSLITSTLWVLLFVISTSGKAQIAITGSTCVVPGITYQYIIKGNWSENATMRFCVDGGMIADTGKTCIDGLIVSTVRIIWDSVSQGSILLKSAESSSSLHVSMTTPINPGRIETGKRKQEIEYDAIPAAIISTSASGGSCTPDYKYQWQQSVDNLSWSDIEGATSLQLPLAGKFKQTVYYRRKVTETNSNTIAFTNVAVVFVNPDMQGRQ